MDWFFWLMIAMPVSVCYFVWKYAQQMKGE